MKFNTPYDRVVDEGEVMSLISKTETAGYVPAEKKILNLINAGKRLDNYRKEQYDIAEGEDVSEDVVFDVTRSPNFDMADASQLALQANARIRKAKAEKVVEKKPEVAVNPGGEESGTS